LTTMTNSM